MPENKRTWLKKTNIPTPLILLKGLEGRKQISIYKFTLLCLAIWWEKFQKDNLHIEKKTTFQHTITECQKFSHSKWNRRWGDYYSFSLRGVSPTCVLARSNIQLLTLNRSTTEGEEASLETSLFSFSRNTKTKIEKGEWSRGKPKTWILGVEEESKHIPTILRIKDSLKVKKVV